MLYKDTMFIKWHNRTKKYYEDLGYKFTKQFDEFEVLIKDLLPTCVQKIQLKCDTNECGEIYTMDYRDYYNRKDPYQKDYCKKCMRRSGQPPSKDFLDDMYKDFKKKGYTLTSNEDYKDNNSPLIFICDKHEHYGEQTTSWRTFNNSNTVNCKQCTKEKMSVTHKELFTMKNNQEYLKKLFLEKDLAYIHTEPYTNYSQSLSFICNKHEDKGIQNIVMKNFNRSSFPCKHCLSEYMSQSTLGSKSSLWRGGVSGINRYIRDSGFVENWRKESFKRYNYKCAITKKNGYLELHHPYSLSKIIKDCLDELHIELKDSVGEYSDCDLARIHSYIKDKHDEIDGIPLAPEVHSLFHKLYGNDNTPDQFDDFQHRFNDGEFEGHFLLGKNLKEVN
ncbi:hypothetical protein [Priestia megaterium]|uniref:hypothetical protein n=1 Tax=Priestia megaterium TaxID=1404 RepID=UPI002877FC2C|nr:hypothetical protein [Priestia megaterium]